MQGAPVPPSAPGAPLWHAFFRPAAFARAGLSPGRALGVFAVLSFLAAALLLFAAAFSRFHAASRGFGGGTFVPLFRLLVPFAWLLYLAYAALVRQATLVLFGEENRRFAGTLSVSAYAQLPLVAHATLWSLVASLAGPFLATPALSVAFLCAALGSLLLAMFWDCAICAGAFRVLHRSPTGRAVLAALAPHLSAVLGLLATLAIRSWFA